MKISNWTLLLLPALALISCGKTDDDNNKDVGDGISGIYQVTTQTKNPTSCTTEGPADPQAPSFYRVFPNSSIFPGAIGWSTQTCANIEECNDASIDLGQMSFDTQAGDTWTGENMTTATGGINCSVTIDASNVTKQPDESVVFEVRRHTGILELTGDDCDTSSPKIEEKRSELTCSSYTKTTATRVQ